MMDTSSGWQATNAKQKASMDRVVNRCRSCFSALPEADVRLSTIEFKTPVAFVVPRLRGCLVSLLRASTP